MIIKGYLDNFTLLSGEKLTTDECQKIRTWLLRNGGGYSAKFENEEAEATNFTGTYHCETVLLSLALLAKKRADILDVDINSASAPLSKAHLQLPGKTTTDALKGKMSALPVSQKCCPACHALVEYFIENVNPALVYPGKHEVWSAAALPPWIPREAGQVVLRAARKALRCRFDSILRG